MALISNPFPFFHFLLFTFQCINFMSCLVRGIQGIRLAFGIHGSTSTESMNRRSKMCEKRVRPEHKQTCLSCKQFLNNIAQQPFAQHFYCTAMNNLEMTQRTQKVVGRSYAILYKGLGHPGILLSVGLSGVRSNPPCICKDYCICPVRSYFITFSVLFVYKHHNY